MPGCSVSLTTESFCSVVNRRRRATPVMTSTFENVSDSRVVEICNQFGGSASEISCTSLTSAKTSSRITRIVT
jgi:hypothetical protein